MNEETVEWICGQFVPIWVNIRRDPVLDLPDLDAIAAGATIHPETRRVRDVGSTGFFLRVLALDPRDLHLLNP